MLNDLLKEEIQSAYSEFLERQNFQPRQCQKVMIAEIARTIAIINEDPNQICVVEAGTGTGKTIAYALAAIPIAKKLKKKIVLATATVALQEQILHKDFPEIRRNSGLDFTFALAKGRRRYLCLSRLDMALNNSSTDRRSFSLFNDQVTNPDYNGLYQEMIEKLGTGEWDGDRDSWSEEIDSSAWSNVSTDHAQCTQRQCSHYENCYFYRARDRIHRVDCIVANQDLVLADLMMGGGAILPTPEDTIYIFDECHHLPDKAGNHFSLELTLYATRGWLLQLPNLVDMIKKDVSRVSENHITILRNQVELSVQLLDEAAAEIQLIKPEADVTDDGWRKRFKSGRVPARIAHLATKMATGFSRMVEILESILSDIEDTLKTTSPIEREPIEHWLGTVSLISDRLIACEALCLNYSKVELDPPYARWIKFLIGGHTDGMEIQLTSHPISVADELSRRLWSRCSGAILTSATISLGGNFSTYQAKSGIDSEQTFISLPSPFRFAEQAVLRVPKMKTDPSEADAHSVEVAQFIPEILSEDKGALVLFTSWRQMKRVFEDLEYDFRQRVLMQGDFPKQKILRRHRHRIDTGKASCIFGLASFAEGVDLPGEYCCHVVLTKLPFSTPDDPVDATLSEWIENRGGNSFHDLMLPNTAMRVIQAAGRLLRTESDFGTVSILDRRLITKAYGGVILNALPPFRREFY